MVEDMPVRQDTVGLFLALCEREDCRKVLQQRLSSTTSIDGLLLSLKVVKNTFCDPSFLGDIDSRIR